MATQAYNRDDAESAWTVLAAELAARRQWRVDSALSDAGHAHVRESALSTTRRARRSSGAEVDIWQSNDEGFYENQDDAQVDMNLRGKFETDGEGAISFRSIVPLGYPIPTEGVVGQLAEGAGAASVPPRASPLSGV